MNLRKSFSFIFLVVASLIAVNTLCAQEPARRGPNPTAPKRVLNVKGSFYRLDLALQEREDGKIISTRNYSLWMRANGGAGILRITHDAPVASRSPFEDSDSSPKQRTRIIQKSIKVDLTCFLKEDNSGLELNVNGEIKGVIPPEKGMEYPPVYRNITLASTALLVPGKATTISRVDDPGSNRQFQIDATATKIK